MKKKVLVDLRVEIDPPNLFKYHTPTIERQATLLEDWARDLEKFIRDHRSQDPVTINIIRDEEMQCGHCERLWEEDEEGIPVCCHEAIVEHEEELEKEHE